MLLNLVGFIRLRYAEVQRAIMGFQLCEASADVEKSDILIRHYLSPHSAHWISKNEKPS